MKNFYILALVVVLAGVGLWYFGFRAEAPGGTDQVYTPEINPGDFSAEITNPWFSLPVGKVLIYEGATEDGIEMIEIRVSGETKVVMGIETLVYRDRVWLNGELVEDTRDYLAQNTVTGDVWYFGEDVDNYENGELKDHDGAWLAGADGAQPGIWMKATPAVGDVYREEYYAGKAEDMAEIVSLDEVVEVLTGTYENCLQVKNWTPLEPRVVEFKYYCEEVASLALETSPDDERVELVSISNR